MRSCTAALLLVCAAAGTWTAVSEDPGAWTALERILAEMSESRGDAITMAKLIAKGRASGLLPNDMQKIQLAAQQRLTATSNGAQVDAREKLERGMAAAVYSRDIDAPLQHALKILPPKDELIQKAKDLKNTLPRHQAPQGKPQHKPQGETSSARLPPPPPPPQDSLPGARKKDGKKSREAARRERGKGSWSKMLYYAAANATAVVAASDAGVMKVAGCAAAVLAIAAAAVMLMRRRKPAAGDAGAEFDYDIDGVHTYITGGRFQTKGTKGSKKRAAVKAPADPAKALAQAKAADEKRAKKADANRRRKQQNKGSKPDTLQKEKPVTPQKAKRTSPQKVTQKEGTPVERQQMARQRAVDKASKGQAAADRETDASKMDQSTPNKKQAKSARGRGGTPKAVNGTQQSGPKKVNGKQSQASSAANPVVANAGGLGSPPKKANGKQSTGSKNDKASDVQALSLRQSEADWETAGAKKVNGKQSAGSKNDGASRNMMQGSKIHNGHSAAAETSSGAGTKPDGGQSKKAEASPSKQRRPEASPKKAPASSTAGTGAKTAAPKASPKTAVNTAVKTGAPKPSPTKASPTKASPAKPASKPSRAAASTVSFEKKEATRHQGGGTVSREERHTAARQRAKDKAAELRQGKPGPGGSTAGQPPASNEPRAVANGAANGGAKPAATTTTATAAGPRGSSKPAAKSPTKTAKPSANRPPRPGARATGGTGKAWGLPSTGGVATSGSRPTALPAMPQISPLAFDDLGAKPAQHRLLSPASGDEPGGSSKKSSAAAAAGSRNSGKTRTPGTPMSPGILFGNFDAFESWQDHTGVPQGFAMPVIEAPDDTQLVEVVKLTSDGKTFLLDKATMEVYDFEDGLNEILDPAPVGTWDPKTEKVQWFPIAMGPRAKTYM